MDLRRAMYREINEKLRISENRKRIKYFTYNIYFNSIHPLIKILLLYVNFLFILLNLATFYPFFLQSSNLNEYKNDLEVYRTIGLLKLQ